MTVSTDSGKRPEQFRDYKAEARACELGREAGLKFVYAGNLPGRVGRWENTYCPACDELLVERYGYQIRGMRLGADGLCPSCGEKIPGVWG